MKEKLVVVSERDLLVVLDYWFYWSGDSEWPTEVLLAMARLMWPDREFERTEPEDFKGAYGHLDEGAACHDLIADVDTGETLEDLFTFASKYGKVRSEG